jgi:hypothetical protein
METGRLMWLWYTEPEMHWSGTYQGESLTRSRLTMGCSTQEDVTPGNLEDYRIHSISRVFFTNRINVTQYIIYIYITSTQFLQETYANNWKGTVPSIFTHACTYIHILLYILYIWHSLYKNKKIVLFNTFTLTRIMTEQILQNYTSVFFWETQPL